MKLVIFTCVDSDHQTLFVIHDEQALSTMLDLLRHGAHFDAELQEEWNRYGEAHFDLGVAETWDDAMPANDQKEALDEWKETLNDVIIWETRDGKTGERR